MKNTAVKIAAAIVLTASCICVENGRADVRVDKMFSDHMVLQRDLPVPIWGTADPDEKVSVSFRGQTKETAADREGKWMVGLDPLEVGEPRTLTVSGKTSVTFNDVLVGEVWLGSGQSNMAGGPGGYTRRDEVLAEMVKAAPYPNLRLYDRKGGWKVAAADDINGFSALLFSFGQPLQEELAVPVGLIVGAVGGTPSGRWLSPDMFASDPGVKAVLQKSDAGVPMLEKLDAHEEEKAKWEETLQRAKTEGKGLPRRPNSPIPVGDLYAVHIAPVVPYAIRGVLWDQGESGTAVKGVDPFTMMGALIRGWRKEWGQGDFPFLYVQKPSGGGCAWDTDNPVTRMADPFSQQPANPNPDAAGHYRELHIRIMQHPNTAMVTAVDLGGGIHPANKSGYGRRACRVALGFVYGRDVEIYGPIYDSHKVEGDKIRIHYKHVGKGLAFRHGEKLQGFEIAGADGVYHWADAKIEDQSVVVSSATTPEPRHVRYGWSQNPTWANLFNKDGLPALTFRSER